MENDDARKGPLRIAVADNLMKYLLFLAKTTTLGKSENDVAEHVLAEALEKMRKGPYPYEFPAGTDVQAQDKVRQ